MDNTGPDGAGFRIGCCNFTEEKGREYVKFYWTMGYFEQGLQQNALSGPQVC